MLPAGAYIWYVTERSAEISQLNQRELSRAAENLQVAVDNAVTNVRNLQWTPGYARCLEREQPYLSFRSLGECGASLGECSAEGVQWEEKVQWEDAVLQSGSWRVEIRVPCSESQTAVLLDVNVGKILGELGLTDSFEYLVVADGDGRVVFEASRGREGNWDDAFRWFEEYSPPLAVPSISAIRLEALSSLPLISGEKLEYEDLTRAGNPVTLQVAGAAYDLVVRPLRFEFMSANREQPGEPWMLGGLVSVASAAKEARILPLQVAIVLVVLLVLGLFAWPFIKRWALAPNERPTFADGYLLLLSTSAMLMVATVLLLDLDYYRKLQKSEAHGLEELAATVRGDLLRELGQMRAQLRSYDGFLRGRVPEDIACAGLQPAQATDLLLPHAERPPPQVRPGQRTAPIPLRDMPEPAEYKAFDLVFWAAPNGQQIVKATTDIANTPGVNVGARPYFREALEGRLWAMDGDNAEDPEFYVQPLRSITTGRFSSGLAIRSELPTGLCGGGQRPRPEDEERRAIAALTAPLASVGNRTLRLGYGFAVADQRGRVLFHSDSRRALRELLFDELSDPLIVQAALLFSRPSSFQSTYRARPHDFSIRPLKELVLANHGQARPAGWNVVAFRDREVMGTVNGQALATCFLWIFMYALALQLLPTMTVLMIQPRPRSMRWLWPHGFNTPLYRRLTLQLICVALASVALQAVFQDGRFAIHLFWVVLLSPLITLAVSAGNYLQWSPKVRPESWEGCNRPPLKGDAIGWHFSTVVLLWLLLAVLPAAGFFKLAWNEEFGRLFAYERTWQRERARDIRLVAEERAKLIQGRDELLAGRLRYLDPPPVDDDPPAGAKGRFYSNFRLPLQDDELRARLSREPASEQALTKASSAATAGPAAWLGGLALFAMLAWWIRYSANKLLFADVHDKPLSDERLVSRLAESDRRAILVVAPKPGQQERISRQLERRAPRAASAQAAAGGSTIGQPPGGERVNVITGLERSLLTAGSRHNALAELDAAVFQDETRVIVFSRVDPFDHVAKHAPSPGGTGGGDVRESTAPDSDELRRWRALRDEFAVIRLGNSAEEIAAQGADPQCGRPSDDHLGAESALLQRDPCRCLWDSSTDMEKLVLVHVAEEGFANPAQRETVRRLLRRGLLVMQPDLRLVNESFRAFVLRSHDPALLSEWEKPVGEGGWVRAKWILPVPLLLIGIFLFGTQQELLAKAAAVVTALSVITSGVFTLAGQLSRAHPARSSEE